MLARQTQVDHPRRWRTSPSIRPVIFMGLLRLAALIFIRSIRRPPRRRLSALTVCRHPLLAAAWQSARAAYLTLHQHPRVSEPITPLPALIRILRTPPNPSAGPTPHLLSTVARSTA